MKKIYEKPSTTMVEVQMVSMIAASVRQLVEDEAPEGDSGNPVNLSRGHDVWEDDEDELY